MDRFSQKLAPAKSYNQVVIGNVRVSVISPKIVRIEKTNTEFIDYRTQAVFCRDFSSVKADIKVDGNIVCISIENRKYIINTSNLKYKVYIDNKRVKVNNRLNLKGTIRTLDGNNGCVVFPNGLMSRSGLTILDDSSSCLLLENGEIKARDNNYVDFYLLAFSNDYLSGLKDFYNLSGKEPIIPKYALGNWWSRYHAYTDKEYIELMDKFIEKDIPFTVSTVDMDWHIVKNVPKDVPNDIKFGRGWTGYTFEKEYFPDYKRFLKELKDRNLKVAFNLHPKDGVRYYEDQYEEMAKANNIDPKTKQPVKFDLLDKYYRNSYFDIIHHPYENDGIDIWWIDWQQGSKSSVKGIDPLFLLNHYHYLDINRDKTDGIILSRFAGIGSQRYPLGFSGDTLVTWKSLKLQPYFTLCSSNVGYTWWSHDIGGHMFNKGNNELYLRWLQLGCFLPINRLHSTNTTLSKEPWLYPEVEEYAEDVLRFRHQLIPFTHSASIINHNEGVPICSPMYYFYDEENAYKKEFKNQYIFGSNLLVAPICKPMKNGISKINIWFPDGKWINIFNKEQFTGNQVKTVSYKINEYPVFIKEGSFLPLLKREGNKIDYTNLQVLVALGEGKYTLYDDNGSIVFTISKVDNGYNISATIKGEIDTKEIEYKFINADIDNITISLDKDSDNLIHI